MHACKPFGVMAALWLSTPCLAQECRASWYEYGSRTANGERFKPSGLTAAHRTYPFGTLLQVSYHGRSVVVRINDRGPFVHNRCLDLARGAAQALRLQGVQTVNIVRLN